MIRCKLICQWLRYNVLLRLLSFLPRFLAYQAVKIIGLYDSLVHTKKRSLYLQGIAKAFPALSSSELDHCWKMHCKMMAREQLDVFFLPKISSSNCERIFNFKCSSVLQEAQKDSQGVILAMGHYGRPIMLSTCLGLSGFKIGMLTQTIDERNSHLDSVERAYLAEKMENTIGASGGRWLMIGDSRRALYKALMDGETIIMMFDLYEPNSANRLAAPFLNGELAIPYGIERIASKAGARIVYGVARDKGPGVEVELCRLPDDPQDALLAAVKELEKDVTTAPWQWWQWLILGRVWTSPRREG